MDKKISQFEVGQYEAEHPQYLAGIRENGIDPDTGDALPIDNVKFPVSEFASSERADEIEGQVSKGIPAWDSERTYAKNDSCYYEDENNPYKIYRNISGSSSNKNPAEDTDNWAVASSSSGGDGGGLEIGDIGIASLPIDETQLKRKYLNGQTILQSEFVTFTTKLKSAIQTYPNLVCTEEEWQDIVTNSKVGQCGKFVIDDTNGTIRLPRVVRIQGQLTLANIGDIVGESLPNIQGDTGTMRVRCNPDGTAPTANSAIQIPNERIGSTATGVNINGGILSFDASRSSSTYQDGAPVQEEAVQYPYFIQLANGTEEEIDPVREIEFNNPFYFGLSKWSQTKIENLSWLLSDGEFKRGDVYVDFYDWILENKSGTIDSGISVKTTDEAYTDYDFVVNETDGTFRTPLKTLEASGSRVVGNGKTLGLTQGLYNTGLAMPDVLLNDGSLRQIIAAYDKEVGEYTQPAGGANTYGFLGAGLTTDPDKSGIETSSQDLFLYWYVGETVQNAHLINAANIIRTLDSKLNADLQNVDLTSGADAIIDRQEPTAKNNYTWYDLYKSGKVKQGGFSSTNQATTTITLPIPMASKEYEIILSNAQGSGIMTTRTNGVRNSTTTSFTVSSTSSNIFDWEVEGKADLT